MRVLGINESSHDAALTLIENGEILFAGHAERYSKKKNDWFVNDDLLQDALRYGSPDLVAYYEKPWKKNLRIKLYGGQGGGQPPILEHPRLKGIPVKTFDHHYTHASAGYFTSKFDDAVVIVLDAIGEFNTSTIWHAKGNKLKKVFTQNYPVSFGLFYSAFTQLLGLKPNEEEYILMGMAAYGDPSKYYRQVNKYFPEINKQKYNFHQGIFDWPTAVNDRNKFDIAAAVQAVYEQRLYEFMHMAKKRVKSENLVFMGGCALNASANTKLWDIFYDVWIMPNPGDAGSSLGAAAAAYGEKLVWRGPYLGHELPKRKYPVQQALDALLDDGVAPVAYGKAEFGPRAFGNRSILADPRDPNIKDKVNKIKKRQLFRPFAPVVMEEHAHHWFEMPASIPYMQYTVKCKRPNEIPSVVHADGTSRVQTVNKKQHPGLYALLQAFYEKTGVPVLLNTSLNIKGQPLLNDLNDVEKWEHTYNQKILR